MDTSTAPQYSAISTHSSVTGTPTAIREWLMLSQQDSPVSRLVSQENAKPVTTTEICGRKPSRLSDELNQPFAYLRTCQDFYPHPWVTNQTDLFSISEPYSETWPKAGIMQNGVCYRLPSAERPIKELDYGSLLPTPCADDISNRKPPSNFHITSSGLPKLVNSKGSQSQVKLSQAVKMLPTPTSSDHRNRGNPSDRAIKRRKEIGKSIELSMTVDGQLNPYFVEWLMGWPVGWTDLTPLNNADLSDWQQENPEPAAKRGKFHKERLQALGNGQVPHTASKAWQLLTDGDE